MGHQLLAHLVEEVKKRYYLIVALAGAIVLSGGAYAYTYLTAGGTITITEITEDFATTNTTATQPYWDQVLDDLASDNKTCGEVTSGPLFDITPAAVYTGDLVANVYLANSANLTKAYRYLNMKLYLSASEEAEGTPNYRMLTLQNGEVDFSMAELRPIAGTWTETTQGDFADNSTLNQVDVTTSPGDVILDTFSAIVTDTFDDATKIAVAANVTVFGGQVDLDIGVSGGTETLRPDGDGEETGIEDPATGPHYTEVDDADGHDSDGTFVSTEWFDWQEDLYTTADHTTGTGTVENITVYAVAKREAHGGSPQSNLYMHIKTNGGEYNGPDPTSAYTTTTSYATYSYTWNNNPETGQAWTWSEIDALQIGVGIRRPKSGRYTRVTQVYVEVNYTPYHPTGTLTSINLLSGETVKSIDSFDYNASAIPSGTGLRVQFSQDNTNWYNKDGTLDGWETLSEGTDSIGLSVLSWSGANFYYHMEFTSDGSDTPILEEISINFSTYYSSGDLTSSTYDTGYDLDWDWQYIYFTITEPSGTDIVFQIRTAATEGGLGSATWYGPAGTSDNYTTSGTAINSVHDGARWIQYKAYFTGNGTSTPTLSEVSITYSGQVVAFTIEVIGGGYCLVSDNISEWDEGWGVAPELYCEITQR